MQIGQTFCTLNTENPKFHFYFVSKNKKCLFKRCNYKIPRVPNFPMFSRGWEYVRAVKIIRRSSGIVCKTSRVKHIIKPIKRVYKGE